MRRLWPWELLNVSERSPRQQVTRINRAISYINWRRCEKGHDRKDILVETLDNNKNSKRTLISMLQLTAAASEDCGVLQ